MRNAGLRFRTYSISVIRGWSGTFWGTWVKIRTGLTGSAEISDVYIRTVPSVCHLSSPSSVPTLCRVSEVAFLGSLARNGEHDMATSTLVYQDIEVPAPSLKHYADVYPRIVDYNASTCNFHSASFESGSSRPICGFAALNCIRLALKFEAEGLLDMELVQCVISSSMNEVSVTSCLY